MAHPEIPDLPESLRARLAAHGAADEQSIRAALEADPELRAEFEAFLATNSGEIDALVAEAFDAFALTRDSDELRELAERMPFLLDPSFEDLVQQAIADAAEHGEVDSVLGLQARLEGLREIRGDAPSTQELLEALVSAGDTTDLLALAQRAPAVLEDAFLAAAEQWAAEAEREGGLDLAAGIRERAEALRLVREQHELAQGSPVMQALIAFLNAPGEHEAAEVFAARRDTLDSDEAQATLDAFFQGADPESHARVEERGALLARLRGA